MSKLWVQLGRVGDILNILPLLYADNRDDSTRCSPRLLIAREFSPLLEGVSYVEKVIYEGPHYEVAKAMAQAEKITSFDVICTQVNTSDAQTETYLASIAEAKTPTELIIRKDAIANQRRATSFQKESWKVAGRLKEWDDNLLLVFDRRNPERENALLKANGFLDKRNKRPVMLLALEGNSSPFPYADLLRELVRGRFGEEYRILELPQAERFYDLLALYEQSALLIAIDSAPLHLAWACRNLPVFALTQDHPTLWHGSPWRPNHVWYCRYGDFPARAIEMVETIYNLGKIQYPRLSVMACSAYESPAISISYETSLVVADGMCSRDSRSMIQDTKRVPYLRDVVRMAMQKCNDDSMWVSITRPQCQMVSSVGCEPPLYAYRIQNGQFRPVVDLFCATKAFWKEILPEIPDLLLSGDYQWSQALWAIFKAHGAADATGCCTFTPDPTPKKAWARSKTLEHNTRLCLETLAKTKTHSRYPKISDQLPSKWIRSELLPSFQYNPSILRDQGKLWMTYRYHPDPTNPVTRLGLAQLHPETFEVISATPMEIEGPAQDDGRLFSYQGEIWMSWVEALTYTLPVRSVMKYGRVVMQFDHTGKKFGTIDRVYQPSVGANDGTSAQKNWVFFEWSECLFCVYKSAPKYEIMQMQGDTNVHSYHSDGIHWPYGDIRGGNIVPWGDKLLRFFHSRLENEMFGPRHRYFVGALTMEAKPPFKVLSVAKKPILYGCEVDDLTSSDRKNVPFYNPNVVFPCGAVESPGGWMISVGVNHAQCVLVNVTEKDLNL